MASSSSMLTFPVGFDFSGAVKQKEIEDALKHAERIVKGQPIVVSAEFDKTGLNRMTAAYKESFNQIQERLKQLNEMWSQLSAKQIYRSDKTGFSDKKVDVTYTEITKEGEAITKQAATSAKKLYAEYEQLTAALQNFAKSLSQIHQERIRAIDEEQRALQKQAAEEARIVEESINKRIALYNQMQRYNQRQAQAEMNRLTALRQKYEEVFSGIKGYSAGLGAGSTAQTDIAIAKQIAEYNKLNEQIQKLTAQYERYKALQAEAGGKGYEKEINDILERRAALQDKVAAITTTADEANAKRVAKENEINKQKRLEEQHDQKILALQERIREVQTRTVPTEATTQLERTNRAYQEQYAAVEKVKIAIKDVESKMATAKSVNDQEKFNQLMREREALYTKQISAEEDLRQKLIAKNDAQKAYDDAKEKERLRLIEQQTAAYDAQTKKIASLNQQTQAQKSARDALLAPPATLEQIRKAYDDQSKAVDDLRKKLTDATSEREKYDKTYIDGTKRTEEHIAAQNKERELTQQLVQEETKLTTALQAKLAAEKANAEQIQRDDALVRRQLESVSALASKIQEYQSVQLRVGTFSTEIEKITTAYNNQLSSIQTLRREYENAVNARQAFSTTDQKNADGTANKAYIEALQKEEQLAKQLNTAEQQLLNTEQRRLELLRQIGLSGNLEQYGRNWSMVDLGLTDQAAIDAQIQKYIQLKETIATLGVEYERLKALHREAGTDITKDTAANKILKDRIAAQKELAKVAQTADQAQNDLLRKQEALTAKITARKQAQIAKQAQEQRQIQQRIAAIKQERAALVLKENTLDNIQKKLAANQALMRRTDFTADPAKFKQVQAEIERLTQKMRQLSGESEKTTKKVTSGFDYQKGVLDRLIQRMAVYTSFGALAGFATKVREITAEFELQRVALGAIINDQAKGNALFSEIKSFALKSPLKILDLTKYTKQVAAYRIETDKLFDTTKRLADVSVGLGVDMQRLVLAYGQVKAATYLRASELRQFTEAGIPMLELLSEKFTKLEGQMVSTADVMKRISKRGVEFKDVEQVLLDMTSAGGMFYNMQEKMGNTLYGMWAKLGDAASIMYDQIGNTKSVNKGMKAVIQMLSDLMRNWDSWAKAIVSTTIPIAALVAALKVYLMYQKYVTTATKANTVADIAARQELIKKSATLRAFNYLMLKCGASTNNATAATLAFAKVIKFVGSIGIMALVTGVTLLVEKMFQAYKEATALSKALNSVSMENITEQHKLVSDFERLAEIAVNAADGSKKQTEALEELRRTYGKMVPAEQLELDYLRRLGHSYGAVTDSIREYIQEQMKRKAIDSAMETTQPRIIKAGSRLKENLSGVVQEDVLTKFISNLQNIIAKNINEMGVITGTYTMEDAYTDALESVGLSWEKLVRISGKSKTKLIDDFANIGDYMKRQEDVIQSINDSYTDAGTTIIQFSKQVEESAKRVAEYIPALNGQVVDKDSYLGQQLVDNERIKAITDNLKFAFGKTTIAWNDSWANLIDTIDESQPEVLSAIDFRAIELRIKEEMKRIDLTGEQQKWLARTLAFVREQKNAYQELVPSSNVIAQIKNGVADIAHALKFPTGVDDVDQFLMKNNESVKNYIDRLEENMKDYAQIVQELTTLKMIQGGLLTIADQEQLDNAEKMSEFFKQAIEYAKQFYKELEKSNGKTRQQIGKERLQEWNEYSSVIEKVYKKYEELQKMMSKDEALQHINEYYSESLELLRKQGLQLNSFPKTATEYQDALRKVRDQLKKTIAEYDLSAEWAAKKHVADIDVKIGSVDIDTLQKSIEEQLKRLSDEIAQSKAAKEFFDNIFSQTKDYDMAMELTMAVYGDTGENYQQQIIEQIRTAFGAGQDWEIDVTPAINVETGTIDYNKLEKMMADALKGEDLEKYREQMKKVIDDGRKFSSERAKQWAKDLSVAQTYAEKRVELARYTQERIREIETDPNLTAETKSQYIKQYLAREAKEAAKLEYEAFKDTPLYIAMFDNLENASVGSLEAMRKKLIQLKAQWKDLDPKNLKEMQKRLNEIEDQLAERNMNPFSQMKQGFKDLKAWSDKLKTVTAKMGLGEDKQGISTITELEQARIDKTNELTEAQQKLNDEVRKEAEIKSELTELQKQYGEMQQQPDYNSGSEEDLSMKLQIEDAQKRLQVQNANVLVAQQEADTIQEQNDELDKQVDEYARIKDRMKDAWKGADRIKDKVLEVADSAYDMAEAFGASEDSLALFADIKDALTTIYDVTKNVSQGIVTLATTTGEAIKTVEKASAILAIISAAMQVATAIVNVFTGAKARAKERAIKREQKYIDSLTYSYDRLNEATERLFGADYIANYNQRLKNLEAQQSSYLKQAQLEREKGKKADQDKVKEYEEAARDAADKISDMQTEVAERIAGTDVASAARDFASAWLDAYISFESTAQSIKEKFNDMVKNMIVESAMSKIVQSILEPFYERIKAAAESDGALSASELVDIANDIPKYANQINSGLETFAAQLESLGLDLTSLGESSEFAGIARDIASASEESVNGLAAMINTQNYYISNVPLILQEVVLIRQILSGENILTTQQDETSTVDILSLQNEYLSHLPAIHTNTEAIAERCERAARACEGIADSLNLVIKPRGTDSAYVVNVNA